MAKQRFHKTASLQSFNPNLDLLLVLEAAHQKRVVAVGHQIVFQALHHGLGAFLDIDDGVAVAYRNHLASNGVAAVVFSGVSEQRAPCADVAPAEVGGDGEGVGRLLHHAIVDADVGAVHKVGVDEVLLFGRAEVVFPFFEHLDHLRQELPESLHYAVQGPNEDAAVPEVVAFCDKLHCCFIIRLFLEPLNLDNTRTFRIDFVEYFVFLHSAFRIRHLNIPIPRFRSARFDADGHQCLWVLGQKTEAQADDALEFGFVGHEMVGRRHHDVGLFATAFDVVGRVSDARGRVATRRLAKHLVGLEHRQVLQNQMLVGLVGHHEEVFVGDDGAEPLVGAADEALPGAKNIKELLGIVVFAEWPKTTTDAASHYDTVVIHLMLNVGCWVV